MANSTQPIIKRTEGQAEAYELGRSYLMGKTNFEYIWITGAAGTGKTTVVKDIVEGMSKRMNICISAPTGKAMAVLRNKLHNATIKAYRTPHSLLGLRDNQDEFELDFIKAADVAIKFYDAIIFDESSMLQDDMFYSLLEYRGNCKFIFVGDVEQLLPPKGNQASIFVQSDTQRGVVLTEIVRQAKLSPITQLSTHLLRELSVPDDFVYNMHEGHGTYLVSTSDQEERTWLRDSMYDAFTSRQYSEDVNYARVICATINMTNKMNTVLRGYKYGEEVHEGRILKGESLISNARHVIDDQVVLGNSDQLQVLYYNIEDYYLNDSIKLKIYNAHVLLIDQDTEVDIRIVHEDSQADYDELLNYFKNMQKQYTKGKPEYSAAAANYKRLLSSFADVSYNYACTCHKAQGSTYQIAFVLLNNLLQVSDANWGYDEKRRWLYTAVTRASKDVIIVV